MKNVLSDCSQGRSVQFSVAMRSLFPRPKFLPGAVEIGLEKHLLLDGPFTPTYEMVGPAFQKEITDVFMPTMVSQDLSVYQYNQL